MEKTVENRRELERKWKITREIMTKSQREEENSKNHENYLQRKDGKYFERVREDEKQMEMSWRGQIFREKMEIV